MSCAAVRVCRRCVKTQAAVVSSVTICTHLQHSTAQTTECYIVSGPGSGANPGFATLQMPSPPRQFPTWTTLTRESPPPYDCLNPISRALTALAQHNPALAAGFNASLSIYAITARAITEGPDAASAMDRAQQLIHTALSPPYGLTHLSPRLKPPARLPSRATLHMP